MTPLARLRTYELNRLLQRAGWPVAGTTDTATAPALAAAVLGVSVSTLRRLEANPWAVSGHHLWLILRAVNRLGVPWTPNDYFGVAGGACESIPVGEPNPSSIYEGEEPTYAPVSAPPRGVPTFEPLGGSEGFPAVSGNGEEISGEVENNFTQPLTRHTRQE